MRLRDSQRLEDSRNRFPFVWMLSALSIQAYAHHDTRSRPGPRFLHQALDVILDRMLAELEQVANFLIGQALK